MVLKQFCLVIVLCTLFSGTYSLAIYRDSGKSARGGRQLNDLLYEEDYYPISPDRESRWESAEWVQPEEVRRRDEDSYDSDERPYNWFYYNKYITNGGSFNHLYNGPKMDNHAGLGQSGNNPPRILPRPAPSFGRTSDMPKRWD